MTTPQPAALDVEALEEALNKLESAKAVFGFQGVGIIAEAAYAHLATLRAPCAERTDPMTSLSERILGLKQTAPDNASKADKQYIWGVNSGLESAAAIVGEDWSWLEGMKMGERPTWENGDPQAWDELHKGWDAAIQAVIERVKG